MEDPRTITDVLSTHVIVIFPFQLRSQSTERLITLTKNTKPVMGTRDFAESTESSKEATGPSPRGTLGISCHSEPSLGFLIHQN